MYQPEPVKPATAIMDSHTQQEISQNYCELGESAFLDKKNYLMH